MNRTSFVILASALLGGLGASEAPAQAQPPANVQRPLQATNLPGNRPMMRTRADFLAQRYKLNDEQKQKVQVVFDEEMKQYSAMRTQTNLPPTERRTKILAIREETNTKLKEIFTPAQWEEYNKTVQQARQASQSRFNTNAVQIVPKTPAPATPAK